MKIGLIAPPWVPVPPPGYGGIESMVDILARGLSDRGHDVTLFATGDSTCPVARDYLFEHGVTPINDQQLERQHDDRAYAALRESDLIHDHTLIGPSLNRTRIPIITTMHGLMIPEVLQRTSQYPPNVTIVAISKSQRESAPNVNFGPVIHHGIEVDKVPFGDGRGDYLLFLGRMDATKGVHTAISVAHRAGARLIIAAKMREPKERQYFEDRIRPHLGNGIEYVGEVDFNTKAELLGGARALLNPIQWDEPFGLVMIEALAAGTPVIASPRGAAPEIVEDGSSGFLCQTVDEAVRAVGSIAEIDRLACRDRVRRLFSAERMTNDYEQLYKSLVGQAAAAAMTSKSLTSTEQPWGSVHATLRAMRQRFPSRRSRNRRELSPDGH